MSSQSTTPHAPADASPPRDARLPAQLTSFVGRTREMALARERLTTTRLLTLTGAGGSGKTRLALEVAAREGDAYAGGVAYAELAPIAHGSLVGATVVAALGISGQTGRTPTDAIVDAIGARPVLLVLDNCEHVVDAAAALADALLRACPALAILATSREALGVAGETAWLIPPLSLPADASGLAGSEAAQLFAERARAVVPGFAVTDANGAAVLRVCRRLDGLPLALELAAARLRTLPLDRIAERLDDRFRLLTTGHRTALPRHQTLRAAIDWSYELLGERERVLLERLGVFAGSFTLQAAESVCAGGEIAAEDVLDLVASLVEKSLVTLLDADDDARYRLLETVREYALERLARRDDAAAVRARHAGSYALLAMEAEPHLTTTHRRAWTERLLLDLDNLRVALEWTAKADVQAHLALAGSLGWFWYSSGLWTEGRQWLDTALLLPGAEAATPGRASALFAVGALATLQGEAVAARPRLVESAALAAAFGDARLEAYANNYLGMTWGQLGDDRCVAPTEAALAWSRRTGDLYGVRLALLILGTYHQRVGPPDRARALMEEAVEVARAFGAERELGIALNCLAVTVLQQGDAVRAVALVHESLVSFRADPQYMFAARSLEVLAGISLEAGAVEDAATLFGAGASIRHSVAATPFKVDGEWIERHIAAGREAIGRDRFDAAMEAGRAMSLAEGIDFALSRPRLAPAPPGPEATQVPRFTGEYAIDAPAAAPPGALRVRALGSLGVQVDGVPLVPAAWSYAKPRELLLYLLCHPAGRTREQVGLALWPDASSAQVRNNFHVTLHHVRRVLGGAHWVRFERGRYRIAPDRVVDFDAAAFEEAATTALRLARRGQPATADLAGALALCAGEFMDGEPAGDWHLEIRDRLRRLRTDVMLALADALMRDGATAEAMEVLERLLSGEPLHEGAHRALMTCRVRAGDQDGAVRQYQRLTQLLHREVGARPSRETSALFHRVQQGERV